MHSISHRFPIRDKQDKHRALLVQEHKALSSFLRGAGRELLLELGSPWHTMLRVLRGSCTKWGSPWVRGVCWPSWPCPYRPGVPHTLQLSAGRGSCCLFFSVLGETREAFNWISLLFLDCCDSSDAGRTEVCFRVCVAWLSMTHLCFSRDTPATEILGLGLAPLKQGEKLCWQEQRAAEMLPVRSTLCCTSTGWMVQRGKEYPGISFPKQLGSLCCSSQELGGWEI